MPARKVWSLTCPTTEIRGFQAPCVVGVDPLFEPSKSTTGNLDLQKNSLKLTCIIFVVPLLNKATKNPMKGNSMGLPSRNLRGYPTSYVSFSQRDAPLMAWESTGAIQTPPMRQNFPWIVNLVGGFNPSEKY